MANKFSIKKLAAGVLALLMVVTALPVSGLTVTTVKAADDDVLKVYRSYNPNSGEHLLTTNKEEHDSVVAAGRKDEGVKWQAPSKSSTPIYRVYNPNSGEHLLVPLSEVSGLVAVGWQDEGIKLYSDDAKGVAIYRVYNPNATDAGSHLYTKSKEEADYLVGLGWTYDYKGEAVFYGVSGNAIESLEATGAKTLKVTFTDDTKYEASDLVVTKDSAKPSVSGVEFDGNTAIITLGSKLTQGTYTVTVKGSKASVDVEDEKIKEFVLVNNNLIEVYSIGETVGGDKQTTATAGALFMAKNQYGEPMACDDPSVTSSFGTATVQTSAVSTNDYIGGIAVAGIPQTLAIEGTKGSLILVDQKTGVSLNAEVVYSAKATISAIQVKGFYNKSDVKEEQIKAGDTATDYLLLTTMQNQYGLPVDAATAALSSDLTITTAGGITGVTGLNLAGAAEVKVDGVSYVGIPLTGTTVKAGDFYATFVNNKKGLITQETLTVAENVVVSSITVSPSNALYAGDKVELNVEAITKDGNIITKYADYVAAGISITSGQSGDTIAAEKQKDGTFKVYYTPVDGTLSTSGDKESQTRVLTVSANDNTSSNYIVKTRTVTVYAKRVAKKVVGLTSDQVLSVATSGTWSLIKKYIKVEDQYSNLLSGAEVAKDGNIQVFIPASSVAGSEHTSAKIAAATANIDQSVGSTAGEFKVYFKYGDTAASATSFDYVATVQVGDTTKATNLKIKSINSGSQKQVDDDATSSGIAVADIIVTGTINGIETVIPDNQYVITKDTFTSFTDVNSAVTKGVRDGEITIVVDTAKGPETLTGTYKYSNLPSAVTSIEANEYSDTAVAQKAAGKLTKADFFEAFTVKDQYGNEISSDGGTLGIGYTIVLSDATDDLWASNSPVHNSTNACEITTTETNGINEGIMIITASSGDLSATAKIKFKDKAA